MGENAKFDIQILVCHMYVLPLHIMILTMYNPPRKKNRKKNQDKNKIFPKQQKIDVRTFQYGYLNLNE